MIASRALVVLAGLAVAPLAVRAVEGQRIVTSEAIVSKGRMADMVEVRDVSARPDGTLSAVLANTSGRRLTDVQLLITYDFLWDNEFHPGPVSPSRAYPYAVSEEIPPGASLRLTFRPEEPLPARSDGHFVPSVQVVSLLAFSQP
jgi:hypothetical protein